jgi:general secretion pathway protein J
MTSISSRQGGFTLLELLVAIGLMGLITVVLLNGVQFGTRVWDRTERHVDRSAQWETVHALLQRQLLRVYPFQHDSPTGPRLVFDGTRETLHFVAPEPAVAGIAGLYAYDLGLSKDGRKDLVLTWSLVDGGAYADRAVLMRGVGTVELRFFGTVAEGRRPEWRSSWRNAKDLPRVISLRAVPADKRAGPPIDITVAPRLWAAADGIR